MDANGFVLGGLIGRALDVVRAELGEATVDRRVTGDRWLIYEHPRTRLRIRLACGEESDRTERVASWTVTYRRPGPSLDEAVAELGLALAGDFEPIGEGELRRSTLRDPESGTLHSLTATMHGSRLVELTAFDEPPDWSDPLEPDEA